MAESGGRRIGVAVDFSECSKKALNWAIENLVRDGDYLILITVAPNMNYEEGEMQLWETVGSPLIPLSEVSEASVMKKYGVKPDAETLDIANTAARQKSITVVMKIYWGDPREKICEAVEHIPLSSLVIGNRGLGGLKRMIMLAPGMELSSCEAVEYYAAELGCEIPERCVTQPVQCVKYRFKLSWISITCC